MEMITDKVQLETAHKFIILIMTVGLREIQKMENLLIRKLIRILLKRCKKGKVICIWEIAWGSSVWIEDELNNIVHFERMN